MKTAILARGLLLASAACILIPGAAFAQTANDATAQTTDQAAVAATDPATASASDDATSNQEIIVTARRRNETLQDVPVAVTAYSGEQLDRQGALDITDIGDTTPNVTLETSRGTNTTLTAFIRGVGQQDPVAGFEQGVGLYLDDVYLNRPQQAVIDVYDVERIEILRGPQGTLYGRNTIGGAIKYVTRRLPDETRLNLRANLGTYEQADLIASASTSLTDGVRVGAAFARLSRGGFGRNLTLDNDNYNKDLYATRGTLEIDPGAGVSFRLSGDYTWDYSNPRGGHRLIPNLCAAVCGQPVYPVLDDEYDSRGGLNDPKQKVKGGGIAGHLDIALAEGLKIRSITAYRKDDSSTPIDFDALPSADVDVPAVYRNKQFSQEVQLVVDRGRLQGLLGAYYLKADAFTAFDVRLYTTSPVALPGLTALTQGEVGTKTFAIFGDFSYDITDQIGVSIGGRYTDDRRDSNVLRQTFIRGGSEQFGGAPPFGVGTAIATTSNFKGKRKDTAFTPRASITYEPNDDHSFYASYAKGFKGGGFDPRGQSTQAPSQSPADVYEFMAFDPETVVSYELGWKGAAINRRLRWALALFQANYKDVQVPGSAGCVVGGIASFCGITTNAGKARFRGVELESNLRVSENFLTTGGRLNLAGTLGYLDAEYQEFLTLVTYDRVTGLPIAPTVVDIADFRKVQNTPKWTTSGTIDYDAPLASGRLNFNSTLSYRSSSQQFELRVPGLDQKGFALLDANLVWRSPGNRFSVGLHGKNLTDKRYITAGYNFNRQNPYTGAFILPNGSPGLNSTLGREGVLTAYYGNPRQVFVSLGASF